MTLQGKLAWVGVAVLGAISLAIVALSRGEPVNAAWLVVASVCIYFIAYRFYALFIARKVFSIDATRLTPAYRHNDGLDYVPTNRYVLFGHHFAAIAGAGPLVGPVLAAQMGYLPGTLWILAGVVFAGAVQDMTVLLLSTRRDGRSLGDMIRSELGPVPGAIAGIGVLLICIIILAVLALVVVKALMGSPWGTFAVVATIPIALLMGVYIRFIRPGRVGEMSIIGARLLLAALIGGRGVSETPALAAWFNLSGETLALIIIGYGFVASVLPVWLLLAPRDYPLDIPQSRHHHSARDWHHHRTPRPGDGGGDALRGRHRAGLGRELVPVPVHHHRLRLGVRLACVDRVRHHPEDDREGKPDPLYRVWRHVDGVVRRDHGTHRRKRDSSRRLLRDEQLRQPDRHRRGAGRPGDLILGLRRHA